MDPLIRLQQNIKHNAEDLHFAMNDLKWWEKEAKRKEKEARTGLKEEPQRNLPPVRSKRFKKKAEPTKDAEKPKKTVSCDYDKWNKFDVEMACKEVDKETSSESEYEENELELKMQQAMDEKEKGNVFFKQGKYAEAVDCYTKGIQCDATNAIFYGNRAMAYLKMEKLNEAEDDCTQALMLDPGFIKAYLRRATARINLGKLEMAKEDLEKVLELEPHNKLARADLEKVNNRIMGPAAKKLPERAELDSNVFMKPVLKPPHLRSKKPLKRLQIRDVDEYGAPRKPPPKVEVPVAAPILKKLPRVEVCPPPPTTSIQFQSGWKTIKGIPNLAIQYLKQLSGEDYPKIFKTMMDAEIFTEIVQILHQHFIPNGEKVYPHLMGLCSIKRFSALLMFTSAKDKRDLDDLFKYCAEKKECSEEEVAGLRSKYEL